MAILFGQSIREHIRSRLIPDEIGSSRFLTGGKLLGVPHAMVGRSCTDKDTEQLMTIDDFLIAAIHEEEVGLARTNEPHTAAAQVTEVGSHGFLHLLHEVTGQGGELRTVERNGYEIAHEILLSLGNGKVRFGH